MPKRFPTMAPLWAGLALVLLSFCSANIMFSSSVYTTLESSTNVFVNVNRSSSGNESFAYATREISAISTGEKCFHFVSQNVSGNSGMLRAFYYLREPLAVSGGQGAQFFEFSGLTYAIILSQTGLDLQVYDSFRYRSIQTIPFSFATGVSAFQIGSDLFVAVANYQGPLPSRFATNSTIFKMSQGYLAFFQSIPTSGATGTSHLVVNSVHMVSFSNYQDDLRNSRVTSSVYVYNASVAKFTWFQDIPTVGAVAVKSFSYSGDSAFLFANFFDSSVNRYETQSTVWLYNITSGRFSLTQSIATVGASDWGIIQSSGMLFCAVANLRTSAGSYSTTSNVYVWNSTTHLLDLFQPIATYALGVWCPVRLVDRQCLLGLSNGLGTTGFTASAYLYCYDSGNAVFSSAIDLPTIGAQGCASQFSTQWNQTTVAIMSSLSNSAFYEVSCSVQEREGRGAGEEHRLVFVTFPICLS